ncbi:MAG: hypothetical protein LBJ64_09400 [Deltaproteobacteria bacterium]|nr:hypothetical protein [Deltaproteobacteria bacterium]
MRPSPTDKSEKGLFITLLIRLPYRASSAPSPPLLLSLLIDLFSALLAGSA